MKNDECRARHSSFVICHSLICMRLDDDLKYFEEPEFKEILAKYEAAREAGQSVYMDADDLTDVAEYYTMVMHDDEKADEAIGLARQLHPDAVSPQVYVARQFMQRGDLETALNLCNAIDDQQDREVYFLRAELFIRDEKTDEAVALLHEVADEIQVDRDFFLYDSAYIFVDYRLYQQALSFADLLEEMAPDWYKTWQVKADITLGQELYKEALTYIEKMLDVDPFSTETWNWSAEAYSGLEQFDKAMSSIEYALAIEPDNERALQLKAWTLLQQMHLEEAHRLYQQLERMAPENEQNWLYDSYCLLDSNLVGDALTAIEKAELLADDVSPNQMAIYEQHAQILSAQGKLNEAIDYLTLAEELGTAGDVSIQDFDFLRARVYAENNRPDLVVSCIENMIHREGANTMDIYYRGAQLFFDTGYYEMADEMFREVLENDPESEKKGDIYAYLAYCAMEGHDDQTALLNLKKAKEGGATNLIDLFGDIFPNVGADELYDYYFYRVFGRWPL